jgi:CheY-like chemotaxis protein
MRILIADDHGHMREVIRQTVAGLASAVYQAGDGGEAIAICASKRPDWVLMDVRMKTIDGLRATAAIKAHLPETRVVIVTQYDDPELRAEAARAGAGAYVLKENLHELPQILTRAAPQGTAGMLDAEPLHLFPDQNRPDNRSRL